MTMPRVVATLVAVVLLGASAARTADAHPLHTTITEVTWDATWKLVRVVIRAFEDDLGAASRGAAGRKAIAVPDYVRSSFVLRGSDGRVIPLRVAGVKRTDDLLWIQLQGPAPAGLRGGTVLNTLIHDLHADQVNIVKSRHAGREQVLLFTRGAGPKRLR